MSFGITRISAVNHSILIGVVGTGAVGIAGVGVMMHLGHEKQAVADRFAYVPLMEIV